MQAAVLLHSDRLEQACSYQRIKLAELSLHSLPIAQPLERGSSLPGQTLQVARSLSEDEGTTASFPLTSRARLMLRWCATEQSQTRGSSLRGAQLEHSL